MSEICDALHRMLSSLPRYEFPFSIGKLPDNGLYVLFEKGETGHGVDRIVRVGTHTGNRQLPLRLQQHFSNENKDRSIFRKNIGRAFLYREGSSLLQQWELDLTTRKARNCHSGTVDFEAQQQVERRVTGYIQGAFTFVVLPIESKEERLRTESALISTVSQCRGCRPSSNWLGLLSPKQKIRESGLWQVNGLYKKPLALCDLSSLGIPGI